MPINGVNANAPTDMAPYIRELEKKLETLETQLGEARQLINALLRR